MSSGVELVLNIWDLRAYLHHGQPGSGRKLLHDVFVARDLEAQALVELCCLVRLNWCSWRTLEVVGDAFLWSSSHCPRWLGQLATGAYAVWRTTQTPSAAARNSSSTRASGNDDTFCEFPGVSWTSGTD